MKRIFIGTLVFLLVSCAHRPPVFLTDKDKVYIVPKNTQVRVIWDEKQQVITTDEDMVLLYKGTYLRLEKEANDNLIQ